MSAAHSHHTYSSHASLLKGKPELISTQTEKISSAYPETSGQLKKIGQRVPTDLNKNTIIWTVLGAGALVYTSFMFLSQQLLVQRQTNFEELNESLSKKDLETISQQMSMLSKDISEVKNIISETATQQKTLAERIAYIDSKIDTPSKTISTADSTTLYEKPKNLPEKTNAQSIQLAASHSAPSEGIKTSKISKEPSVKPKPVAPDSNSLKIMNSPEKGAMSENIETSSVKTSLQQEETLNPRKTTNKTIPNSLALQIASGPSLESLRISWELLSEKHSNNLKSLEPRYTTSMVGNETIYNLVVGPVVSEVEAKKMCQDLNVKAIPCNILKSFNGEVL